MRADYTVFPTDWVHGVWWAEISPALLSAGTIGRQWFGHIRSVNGIFHFESVWRHAGTIQWEKVSAFAVDADEAQHTLFAHREKLAKGCALLRKGGWLPLGGADRMRQLAEDPFPFQPWPDWLSLTIIEWDRAGRKQA